LRILGEQRRKRGESEASASCFALRHTLNDHAKSGALWAQTFKLQGRLAFISKTEKLLFWDLKRKGKTQME